MAPDGKSAVVLLLHGSTSGPDEWPYHANGGAVMIAIENGKARVIPGEVKLGSVPEGVAYSANSKYIYAGDFTDKLLHIINVSPEGPQANRHAGAVRPSGLDPRPRVLGLIWRDR